MYIFLQKYYMENATLRLSWTFLSDNTTEWLYFESIYWNEELCSKRVHSGNSPFIVLGGAPTFTFIFIFQINGFLSEH